MNYPNALTNDTGINKWIAASSNDTVKIILMNDFNLTESQLDMILFWLFEESFQDNVVPELMILPPPDGVGMNITKFARVLLLEQWANGTALGEVIFPYGFPLPLKAGIIYGFEIGYQGKNLPILPSNASLESVESLWDASNEYSLVNDEGLRKWYIAINNPTSTVAENVQIVNSLEDKAMEMILSWLPNFRDNVMPFLAQEEMELPTDSTSFANSIELGMVIPGGILISVSTISFSYVLIKKKKLRS